MPDDVTEEIAEQETEEEVDEGEASFGEEYTPDGAKVEAKDKPPEKPDIKDDDLEPVEKDKPDEKAPAEDKPPDEKDLTAKDLLDRRLAEIDDQPPSSTDRIDDLDVEDTPKQPEKGPPPPDKAPAASRLSKEVLGEYLGSLSENDLPEEVVFGDTTIDLKDYAQTYPDEFNAIKAIGGTIAQGIVNKALEGGQIVKADDVNEKFDAMELKIAQLEFDTDVTEVHSDYKQIKKSDEFIGWVNKQSAKIKAMAKASTPEDGIMILNYYKEDVAKASVKKFDDKKSKEKARHDNLHKSTMRSKDKPVPPADFEVDENDAEGAFTEEAAALAKG